MRWVLSVTENEGFAGFGGGDGFSGSAGSSLSRRSVGTPSLSSVDIAFGVFSASDGSVTSIFTSDSRTGSSSALSGVAPSGISFL